MIAAGVVALHPVAPAVEQQRTVRALVKRLVDGLLGSRVQRDLCGLVALAENPQGRLVPLTASLQKWWGDPTSEANTCPPG
jgi:hypothetical protein